MVVAIHRAQNDSIASSPNDVMSRWKKHVKAVPMSQSPKMSTVTKKSEPSSSSSSSGTSPVVEKKFGPKIGNKSDNISSQRKSWKTSSAATTSITPTCNSNSATTKYGGVKKSTSFQPKEAKAQSAEFIKPQLKKISDNNVKTPGQSNTLKQNPELAYKANLKKVSVGGGDRSSHSRHGPINSVSKVSTVNTGSQRSVASYPTNNRDQKTMSKGMGKGNSAVSTEYSKASLKKVSSTTGNGSEKVASAEKSEPVYKALLRKTKSSRIADDELSVASMGALDKRKKKATAASSRFNRDSTAAGGGGGRGGDLTGISTKSKWSKKKYGGGGGGDYDDRSVASMGALSKRKQQYESVATSSSTLGKIDMGGLTGFSSKNGTSTTKGGEGGSGKKWPPVMLKKQVGAKEQQVSPKNVMRKEEKKPDDNDDDDNNNNNKEEPAYLVALKKAKGGGDSNEQQSKKMPQVENRTVSEKSIDEEPAYKIALRKAANREGNRNEKNPSARNLASAAKPSTTTKFGSFKNVSQQEKSSTEKRAPSYKGRTAEQTCETTSSSPPAERKVPEGPDACAKASNSPVIHHFELPKKTSPNVPSVATDQPVEEKNKATTLAPHSADNSTREEISRGVEIPNTVQDVPLPKDEDTDVVIQTDCDPNETPVDTLPSQQLAIDEITEKPDTNQFDYTDNEGMPPHEPADSVNGDFPNIGRAQPQPHDNTGDSPAETVAVEKSKTEESTETALSEAGQMAMKQLLHPNETKAQQRARRRRERESFKGLKRFLLGRKNSKKSLHK